MDTKTIPYKIVACDLDGTLLGPDKRVSQENWQAIERMRDAGVYFVPSSGRAFEEMPGEILESPLIRFYITSDGAAVYDKQTGATHELPMPRELGWEVLDKVLQYPVCNMIHADTKSYVDARTHSEADYARYNMNEHWIRFALEKEAVVEDLAKFAYDLPAIQLVVPFFKNMADLQACKAYFEADSRVIVAQSDPYDLEIFDVSAGKGNALGMLADILGVPRTATIAVGDSTNDSTMVMAAGLGLAMDNAVPELKAIADEVICDNWGHCAQYIYEHYICSNRKN